MALRSAVVMVAVTALVAACGGGGGSGDGGGGSGDFGLDARKAPSLAFPIGAPFEVAYPGLSFGSPLVVASAPGDGGHLYVANQSGTVEVFERRDDVATKSVFLDIADRTNADGEQGLLGFAFDPGYASNGYVYAYYTANTTGSGDQEVVARYSANVAARTVDPSTEFELLRFDHSKFPNHNGGCIGFGPDGMLYIASGDGGSGGDPDNNAQDLGSMLGKIFRIRTDGTIPSDNPFVGSPGARGEIWAYGLRNPFRFSFDPVDGRLWVGDVGQDRYEEVDLVVKGGNYGWRKFEGNHVYKDSDPTPPDARAPVIEYDHGQGNSITGGVVYRGSRFPALAGKYLYGDFGSGTIWALTESGGTATSNVELGTVGNVTSFGVDPDGEVLITAYDGHLHRLVDNSGSDEAPAKLSDTGVFSDLANLTPANGVVEYTVNAPFWSDGAVKRRWIAVPGTHYAIAFSAGDAWAFPRGSVIVKHFEIDLADGTRKRLETRVLVNQTGGWSGYTYRWNEAGTEADLLDDSETVALDVKDDDSPGGSRTITYEFPSRGACLQCHTAAAGEILGVRTRQLNGDFRYPNGVTDNQLRTLAHAGYFDRSIGDPATYDAMPDPADTAAALSDRARAYLDANCSQCHRPGGTGGTMDLRHETARGSMNAIDADPAGDSFGVTDAKRIAPGEHERSLVWVRMSAENAPKRMPPIASHAVDTRGAQLLADWIDAGAQ